MALIEALTRLQADLLHSVSPLDQAIATDLLADRERLIKANATLLRERLRIVRGWSEANADLVDWLPPNAGAITCFRLRDRRFDAAARRRLASTLSELDLALAPGAAFGDEEAVYRMALGYGSSSEFASALEDLGRGLRGCALHCDALL